MEPHKLGKDPIDQIPVAVRNELINGVCPTIVDPKDKIGNTRENAMDLYAKMWFKEAIESQGLGYCEYTNEGCSSDVLYQKVQNDNLCVRYQMKTNGVNECRFRKLNKCYDGCVIILMNLSDGRRWYVSHRELMSIWKCGEVTITSSVRSKKFWDQRSLTGEKTSLEKMLRNIYEEMIPKRLVDVIDIDTAQISQSASTQQEIDSAKKLSSILPLTDPPCHGLPYDRLWLTIRLQLKSDIHKKPNHVGFTVALNKVKENLKVPYDEHDFDALVVTPHSPHHGYFYIIPIQALIQQGKIKTDIHKGATSLQIYPHEPDDKHDYRWANEFLFRFDDTDVVTKITLKCQAYGLLCDNKTEPVITLNITK